MKKLLRLTILAAMGMLLFTSCSDSQPTAIFNVSNSNPSVGETVYFYNNSIDAEYYEWDFGDGTSSTQMSPAHTYYTSGSKFVTLTALSKRRKKSSMAYSQINVKSTGDVMFWTDESTVYNITVNLQGVGSKTITSYYNYTPSDCGASGCATFDDLEAGTYYFTAENYYYNWSGSVTVEADRCSKMLLYASKAEKQSHPENQSTELLTAGTDVK